MNISRNISKFVTPEIIFGTGALSQVGESAARLGAYKVFLVSDPGVVKAGWVDKALPYLERQGLSYHVWTGVSPNPKDHEVEEGVNEYLSSGCDAVVAIGGGSAIDAGKAVAILATNGGSIQDYEGIDRVTRPLPPMVVVPSTAGSGSEVSQFSIIVDTRRKVKMTIISKSLVPDIAITDPLLLATVDQRLTANTGLDALTHAIEAYVSVAATWLTDVHALSAMRLVASYLPASVASQTNEQAKVAMAMASLEAGLAFSNAILGAVHAMTHQLGGLLDMPHGEANAILLPYVMEFNRIAAMDKYIEIARALGAPVEGLSRREASLQAVEAVRRLAADIGVSEHLSRLGLKEEFIPQLSQNAVKDACLITNPRDATAEDIEAIFRKAL
ncbi:MAG: iron-containing alcohol dehydrogenase [Acetobacteraceae bacterium]|nr:iron-containing alcohol dehydrogenase [Acetobacteraceae bacterium]